MANKRKTNKANPRSKSRNRPQGVGAKSKNTPQSVGAKSRNRPQSISRKSTAKPKRRSFWGMLFRAAVSPLGRRLILLAIILIILFWQWQRLISWATEVRDSAIASLGWGIALIVLAIGILGGIVWRRKLSSLIYRWNKWLGGIAFMLAIWGILAIFRLGGSFGQNIARYSAPEIENVLRILGLVIIGVILIAPRACFRLVPKFISWLRSLFKRRPIPRYLEKQLREEGIQPSVLLEAHPRAPIEEKPALPSEMAKPTMPPERVIPKSPLVTPLEKEAAAGVIPAQSPQELRQVAQEVWKKYGQSSDLVIVDGWRLPPIDILDRIPEVEFGKADNIRRAKIIEDALASYGVEAKVVQINAGPTVTQFGVEPG